MAIDTIGTNAIANTAVTDAKLAATLNLSSKTVTVPAGTVTTHVTPTDLTPVKQDVALVAFEQIRADNRTAAKLCQEDVVMGN